MIPLPPPPLHTHTNNRSVSGKIEVFRLTILLLVDLVLTQQNYSSGTYNFAPDIVYSIILYVLTTDTIYRDTPGHDCVNHPLCI